MELPLSEGEHFRWRNMRYVQGRKTWNWVVDIDGYLLGVDMNWFDGLEIPNSCLVWEKGLTIIGTQMSFKDKIWWEYRRKLFRKEREEDQNWKVE